MSIVPDEMKKNGRCHSCMYSAGIRDNAFPENLDPGNPCQDESSMTIVIPACL